VKVFRAIVQHSSELVVVVDEAGVLQYVSPSARPLLGYRPEDVEGSSVFDVVHPDELEVLHKRFEDALETPGIGVPFEVRPLGHVRDPGVEHVPRPRRARHGVPRP
jgi:PAS domain S-box-containing protein